MVKDSSDPIEFFHTAVLRNLTLDSINVIVGYCRGIDIEIEYIYCNTDEKYFK